MAEACGLSAATVSRIWRAFGLKPHRTETFKLSKDLQRRVNGWLQLGARRFLFADLIGPSQDAPASVTTVRKLPQGEAQSNTVSPDHDHDRVLTMTGSD